MNKKPYLAYTSIVPEIKDNSSITKVIILLHGYGSNMKDLASLSEYIDASEYMYISINAPIKLSEFGNNAFAWFQIDTPNYLDQLEESTRLLENTIDHLTNTFDISNVPIVLGGFSQGGMMAMNLSLTTDKKFNGIAALSSRLITAVPTKKPEVNFFISHGSKDNVIDVSEGHKSRDILQKSGHRVTYQEYDIGHEISADCLTDFTTWLKSIN